MKVKRRVAVVARQRCEIELAVEMLLDVDQQRDQLVGSPVAIVIGRHGLPSGWTPLCSLRPAVGWHEVARPEVLRRAWLLLQALSRRVARPEVLRRAWLHSQALPRPSEYLRACHPTLRLLRPAHPALDHL